MEEKQRLYFERGAREVWICDEDGRLTFHDAQQRLERSVLVADFPLRVQLAF